MGKREHSRKAINRMAEKRIDRVAVCMNPGVIRALYDDPFVQDRYGESDYYGWHDKPDRFYLVGYSGDEPTACVLCIIKTWFDIEVHLCVPEINKRVGPEFARMVIDWLFQNAPLTRITTSVVGVFPQVRNFVRKLGFTEEGTARSAAYRDGQPTDIWCFSLLRGEPYGRQGRR
jgi:RimJ/RimL family protein N-acetyltransferase